MVYTQRARYTSFIYLLINKTSFSNVLIYGTKNIMIYEIKYVKQDTLMQQPNTFRLIYNNTLKIWQL